MGGKEPGMLWGGLVGPSLLQLQFSSPGDAGLGRKQPVKLPICCAWILLKPPSR